MAIGLFWGRLVKSGALRKSCPVSSRAVARAAVLAHLARLRRERVAAHDDPIFVEWLASNRQRTERARIINKARLRPPCYVVLDEGASDE